VRGPAEGEVLAFVCIIVSSAIRLDQAKAEADPDGEFIGALPLKGAHENVVVFARWQPLTEPYRSGCEQLLRTNRFTSPNLPDPWDGGALLWVSTQGGLPCVTDLPLPLDFAPATPGSDG